MSNCGAAPKTCTADSGYWRETHERYADELGTDLLINLQSSHMPGAEELLDLTDQRPRVRMARRLQSKTGQQAYARRKAVVEPVFGQIKEPRGFRRFLLRGIDKVIGEWSLVCTTHNLLKLFRRQIATA